jgi:hypothetical protein
MPGLGRVKATPGDAGFQRPTKENLVANQELRGPPGGLETLFIEIARLIVYDFRH